MLTHGLSPKRRMGSRSTIPPKGEPLATIAPMLVTAPLGVLRATDSSCSGDPDSKKNELGFHKVANYCLQWKQKRGGEPRVGSRINPWAFPKKENRKPKRNPQENP